jgi:serine kinase of HPr protein (carbohydrate metabolism regulator)
METKKELTEKYVHKLVTSVMTAQILNNQLHELSLVGLFQKKDKQIINNAVRILEHIESSYYDKFWEEKEKDTSDVYLVYDTFIKVMSSVPIYEVENLMYLYDLYKNHTEKLNNLIEEINASTILPDES